MTTPPPPERNTLRTPPSRTLVAPSILSADFAFLLDDARHTLDHGADLLHIDVMDGHFVPNLSMGPAVTASLRRHLPDATLDVHLMVTDPAQYIEPFAHAGADHISIHAEPAMDPTAGTGRSPLSQGYDPIALAHDIRTRGLTSGLAINPPTDPAHVDRLLGGAGDGTGDWAAFDLLLVMSVNPGFSGQAFIPEALDTARTLRRWAPAATRLQIDGGITPDNAPQVRQAGIDTLVAASAIFGKPREDRPAVIAALRA